MIYPISDRKSLEEKIKMYVILNKQNRQIEEI